MIRAIVLDMDGVIRHIDLEKAEKASQSINLTFDELMSILWDNDAGRMLLRGEISRDAWWRILQSRDDRLEDVPQQFLWDSVFAKSSIDKKTVDYVRTITESLTTAIFTNCDHDSKTQIISDLGPNHPFDYVVSSSDIGAMKPETEAFLRMLETIRTSAQDCVFFDDSPTNVEAAMEIGVHSFLFEDLTHLKNTLDSFR
ncbi:MAG: HAD-IA family hydrolase [Candidatus Thorarchaeota archaeon]